MTNIDLIEIAKQCGASVVPAQDESWIYKLKQGNILFKDIDQLQSFLGGVYAKRRKDMEENVTAYSSIIKDSFVQNVDQTPPSALITDKKEG